MKIITNVWKLLIAVIFIIAVFVPRLAGIPTAIIFALMGLVLFMFGVYTHLKSPSDSINRAEFHGACAFLFGLVMATNTRITEILSVIAQLGITVE